MASRYDQSEEGSYYGGGGQDGYGQGYAQAPHDRSAYETISFYVPNYVAGSIIGAGGAVIKRLRNESGAKIVVDPPQPGSSERVVTISGSVEQIQYAQHLIQKCTGWGE